MLEHMFTLPNIIFMIPIVAIVGGVLCSMVNGISRSAQKRAQVREREISRREIAAYVAEGSMSPEEGERLLKAGSFERS